MTDETKPPADPGDAGAQAAPDPGSAAATTGVGIAEANPLTLDEVLSWNGFKLDDIGGATVGKIEGAYVDDPGGRPEWLLARMGRFGHHCLVPARDAVVAAGHVWVPYSRALIRKAPKLDAGKPLECDRERELLEHYGVGTAEAGRGAELAKRDASAVTARPA